MLDHASRLGPDTNPAILLELPLAATDRSSQKKFKTEILKVRSKWNDHCLACVYQRERTGIEKGLHGRSSTGTVPGRDGIVEHDASRRENSSVTGRGQLAIAQSSHGTEHRIVRALW